MNTEKTTIQNDLLTFSKNSGCHSKEIEYAVDQWFNILLAHIRYQDTVVFEGKRQDSEGRRSFEGEGVEI